MREFSVIENQPEKPSLNEVQTISFLEESGVQRLFVGEWTSHQPLLYVLDEGVRNFPEKDGKERLPHKVASVARLDDPIKLNLTPEDPGNPVFIPDVQIMGGQIDYYAINPDTKKATLVGTSHPYKDFYIKRDNLFSAADALFPKSDAPAAASDGL